MKYQLIPATLGLFSILFILETDASESTSSNLDSIESITVTASRTPLSLDQTGSSLTIITKEDIQRRNVINLVDILRDVPGFAVSRSGPLGAITQLRVRGAEANHLLVMIDGIEVNDPAQSSEFNFAHLQASNIERVEIVRGPQSAIWGSDALAGVVNVITRSERQESSANIAIEAGSFGTQTGKLNLRTGGKEWQINFNADYLDSDGINISESGSEEDAYNNTTVSFGARYQPTEMFSVDMDFRDTTAENNFDGTDFSTGLPNDSDFRTQTDLSYSQLRIKADTLDGTLQHIFSATLTDTESNNFDWSTVSNDFLAQKKKYSYQISYSSVEKNQTLTMVFEHENTAYQQRGLASFWGDPNQNRESLTKSLAAEYLIHLQALTLSVSSRRDTNDEFKDATPWRLTAAYTLKGTNTKIHASLGESVKNPTFTDRFGYFTNFLGNPDLRPERSKGWELGVSQTFLDDSMNLSAVYFHAELEDEINGFWFSPVLGTFTSTNVKGQSRRQGTELALAWQATENFDSTLAYTYLDSTEETAGIQIDEIRRPRHMGALNLNYNWNQKANLNLAVQYNGRQSDNFYPPYPPYQERVSLDAFTLVNVAFSYELSDQVSITARIENLLDKDYEEVYGFQTPGRSTYAGVRMKW